MALLGRSPESREKSRAFVQAVYDNGGRADTKIVRQATGLTRGELKYRYEMLEDRGLIRVEYDFDIAATGESPVKVAILTELAEREIRKGLLQGGQYQPESDLSLDEVAESLQETQEFISDNMLPQIRLIGELESRISELEQSK
ncbi:hypothetical protein EXE49_07990 [Halorubrum sp. ASP121]|uniref:hypothetical protein n=1 Tax=Halorubrum sp. ASP121 TaxID=1855858 RepID=UPI0010F54CDB|nr:hypothetical protein [Halorubrum sp. ASP121]TKX50101.1 hypothetical protein EXE49_07990 [Halorubrum sp. ASP121]